MTHKKSIEALDRNLRDVLNGYRFISGVTFLFAGKFKQKLPIITEVNACVKRLVLWSNVQAALLTINMRVQMGADAADRELYTNLGDGKVADGKGEIRPTGSLYHIVPSLEILIENLYGVIKA